MKPAGLMAGGVGVWVGVGGESTLLRNCKVFPLTKDAMREGRGRGGSHWGNATRQQQYFDAILRILGVNFSKHTPFPLPPVIYPILPWLSPSPCCYIAMASTAFCNFNCFWLTLLRIACRLALGAHSLWNVVAACAVRDVDDIDITWQHNALSNVPVTVQVALHPAPCPHLPPALRSKSGKSSMAKVLANFFLVCVFLYALIAPSRLAPPPTNEH